MKFWGLITLERAHFISYEIVERASRASGENICENEICSMLPEGILEENVTK